MWGSDMVWWDSRSAPGLAGELSRENVWGSLQKRRLKMFGMGYRAHQSKSLGPAWASGETMCNARALNFHGVNMDAVHMVWRSQGWNRIEKSWKFTLASGSPLQCLLIIWSECYIYIYTSIRLPPLCQVLARSNSPGVSCSAWRTLQLEESFPQSCRCCTMKIMACNLVCHFNPLLHHSSAMGSIMINRINRHCIEWLHDVCVSTAVGRKLINIIGPIC